MYIFIESMHMYSCVAEDSYSSMLCQTSCCYRAELLMNVIRMRDNDIHIQSSKHLAASMRRAVDVGPCLFEAAR